MVLTHHHPVPPYCIGYVPVGYEKFFALLGDPAPCIVLDGDVFCCFGKFVVVVFGLDGLLGGVLGTVLGAAPWANPRDISSSSIFLSCVKKEES